MPVFIFVCPGCGTTDKKLLTLKEARTLRVPCPGCQTGTLELQMGTPSALAKTTGDEYRGKSVDLDVKEKLKDRAHDHFVKHDLPRIIEKEGMAFAQRQGFVDFRGQPLPRRK